MYFSSALSIQPSFTASQLEFAKTIRPRLKSEANDLDDEVFFPEPIYMSSLGSPRKRSSDMQNVHLDSLSTILEELCKSYKKLGPTTKMLEECQHPASSANYWISKWVDYSDKFGFGKSSRKIHIKSKRYGLETVLYVSSINYYYPLDYLIPMIILSPGLSYPHDNLIP